MSVLQSPKTSIPLQKYNFKWVTSGNNGNIYCSGNVGINTRSDPQYNLDVSGTSNISGNAFVRGNLTTINDVSFNGNLFVGGSLSGTSLSTGTGTITGGAITGSNYYINNITGSTIGFAMSNESSFSNNATNFVRISNSNASSYYDFASSSDSNLKWRYGSANTTVLTLNGSNGNLTATGAITGSSLSAGTTGTITGGAILIKTGTKTLIDIINNSIIIPSVSSYQFFNRQMTTNEKSFTSSAADFASGVKIIHLSYSHGAVAASTCVMTLILKNGTTTLQTLTSPRYVSTNIHLSNSFYFKTDNIASQNITMTISIAITSSTYTSDQNDYINCVMYNLPNNQ